MITIKPEIGLTSFVFPDGQPHIQIGAISEGDAVRVVWNIRNPTQLLQLLEISNALDGLFAVKEQLVVPYLMGARFDRRMQRGDSVDLKVIADMINYCGFKRVHLFDVHSDVALQLIDRSHSHDNRRLVKEYKEPNAVLICPDAGAVKKVGNYAEWNENIKDVIYCIKSRDLSNGKVTLNVVNPETCVGRNCVIVDDICDGGATFLAIAKQIHDFKPKSLTLIVSHGIFSKGFDELSNHFTNVITSDSYNAWSTSKDGWLKVVPLGL